MFISKEYFPGVFQITDCMGVNMTLIRGSEKALLVDAGYGLENVREYAEKLAGMPVQLLATHGHHDHALGTACFDKFLIFSQDEEIFRKYTGKEQRIRVAGQAESKGLSLPEDFLTRPMAEPEPLSGNTDDATGFECVVKDLGGITVRIFRVPGHTPGSAVLFIPERELLLTGDNWNPCTWIWFPEAESVLTLKENMRRLTQRLTVTHVLCPHRPELFGIREMTDFFDHITDETLKNAPCVQPENGRIRRMTLPGGMELMFDAEKAGLCAPGSETI